MYLLETLIIPTIIGILLLGKHYFRGAKCKSYTQMTNKIIVITGASSGLGYETAIELANAGGTIVMACRNEEKTKGIINLIKKGSNNDDIHFIKLDLEDLDSVRTFATEFSKKFSKLDILINNAGIATTKRELTKDRFEKTMGVNYLAHYYLTYLLTPLLVKAEKSRVINLSSMFYTFGRINLNDFNYEKKYTPTGYMDSKLAILLFAQEYNKSHSGIFR